MSIMLTRCLGRLGSSSPVLQPNESGRLELSIEERPSRLALRGRCHACPNGTRTGQVSLQCHPGLRATGGGRPAGTRNVLRRIKVLDRKPGES